MDINSLLLPKASGIETVRKELDEFIAYWIKAKGNRPDKVYLSSKASQQLRKSLVAQKLTPEFLEYKQIRIVEL